MTIGDRIKSRRMELGLSQDELAKRLGYASRSSINKIELGERNLTQTKIKAIADALDTTPGYIMGWDKGNISEIYIPVKSDNSGLFTRIDQLDENKVNLLLQYLDMLEKT